LADDESIKQVLSTLTQLARYRQQPFLLCFDAVDVMEGDRLGALSRFLHALLDAAGNLLVITAGVTHTLLRFLESGTITETSWDRLARFKIALQRIPQADARQILEKRLCRFLETFRDVPEVASQIQRDSLFPLGGDWFEERLKELIEVRPRDLIDWASERWAQQQSRLDGITGNRWLACWADRTESPPPNRPLEELIDEKVDEQIAALVQQRLHAPHTLPPSADNLLGLVDTLLGQWLQPGHATVERLRPPKSGARPVYDLLVNQPQGPDGRPVRTGLVVITTASATSTAAYLRRLVQDQTAPNHVLLVTDQRQPPVLGVQKRAQGRLHLEELRRRGTARFEEMELPFDQYAALDALQGVVGMAVSGDLEVESASGKRPVHETEVIASHHRRDRYAAQSLFQKLLGEREAESTPQSHDGGTGTPADEKDLREFLMARLALTMGSSSQELAVQYVNDLRLRKRPGLDLTVCKPRLEEVAWKMHHEELVHATVMDGGLSILPRKSPRKG
jgi:hypothetical protein